MAAGLLAALCIHAASAADGKGDSESDALNLASAPEEAPDTKAPATRLLLEGALGTVHRRYGLGSDSVRRASFDLYHASRFAPGWRGVVSNRLDHIRPASPGSDDTLNSLREAYLGWEHDDGNTAVEFGRINLRYGPGYGYNPTDFLRDGALRVVTTLNPFALRENRLGVGMLRVQRMWEGGSVSLALAPKLADAASGEGMSADLGATNNRHRAVLAVSQRLTERVSGQVLLYKEAGLDVQPGASLTSVVGEAAVAHAEWSFGREPGLADRTMGLEGRGKTGHRFAGGLTYTTATKLSITAEWQYNDFALGKSEWARASSRGPSQLGAYLLEAERRQDLAARRALLLYATQQSLGWKNLALTGFVRINADDRSRLSWLELRYHWPKVDVALQWQQYSGKTTSQYGVSPDRRVLQAVAAYHFR